MVEVSKSDSMENSAALLICFQGRHVLGLCGTDQFPRLTLWTER
jgi:hypothetical protein